MIKTAAVLLSAVMVTAMVPPVSAAETFTYSYPIYETKVSAGWSDAYFSHSAEEYDHELAKASLALSLASMTSSETVDMYTSRKTDPPRDSELRDMLTKLGFSDRDYYSYRYDVPLSDDSDEAAFGISHKKLDDGSELVAVGVRGGGYGAEWASNFRVGKGRYSSGFYKAGNKIKNSVNAYCKQYGIKNAKIWIAGYSRGSAVTQTAAVCLADSGVDPKNIYAYAFAAPSVARKGSKYDNIHCIINPCDPVCMLPLPDWGFDKAGVSHIFDTSSATDKKTGGRFRGVYKKITGTSYKADARALDMPAAMCDALRDVSPTVSSYVDKGTEDTFVFLMKEINATSELNTDDIDMKKLMKKAVLSGVRLELDSGSARKLETITSADWSADMLRQHDPAVYCAYLYSADADKCYTAGTLTKTVTVEGDADIKVYKGGKLICTVTDGSVKGRSLLVTVSEGVTRIYFHGDGEYTVKLIAKDKVTYSVTARKNGKPTGTVKISAAGSKTYTGKIPMDEKVSSSAYKLS